MKKFGMLFLALVLVFALAACAAGTGSTKGSNSTAPSQSSLEESQTPEDPQDQNTSEAPSETGNESPQTSEASDESRSGSSWDPAESDASSPDQEPEGSKTLVAYFSATGNTEGVAQKLAGNLGELTRFLKQCRCGLLDRMHESQKRVDLMDYLIRQTEKQSVK